MTLVNSNRKYALPTVDYLFKKVFGTDKNKPILISLLQAILDLQIDSLTIENSELSKDFDPEKASRLDILATLNSGQKVNIEIQLSPNDNIRKRSLFYASRLIGNQEVYGKLYSNLVPVYIIFILDFNLFANDATVNRQFVIKEKHSNQQLFERDEMFALHFVEIQKFKETDQIPKSQLERWLLFFKTKSDQILEELKMADKYLEGAISEIEYVQLSKQDRWAYESRMAGQTDRASELAYADQNGIEKGIVIGIDKGIEIGKAEGLHQGKLEMFASVVKGRFPNLTNAHMAKITFMTEEQLNEQVTKIFQYSDQNEFEKMLEALPVRESQK
jgi:predicted transposase/invertase (TIGR01784 family)